MVLIAVALGFVSEDPPFAKNAKDGAPAKPVLRRALWQDTWLGAASEVRQSAEAGVLVLCWCGAAFSDITREKADSSLSY